jgi:hypothetical protein
MPTILIIQSCGTSHRLNLSTLDQSGLPGEFSEVRARPLLYVRTRRQDAGV